MTQPTAKISIPKIMISVAERQLTEAARRSPPKRRQRLLRAVKALVAAVLGPLGQVRNAPSLAGPCVPRPGSRWSCKTISLSRRSCQGLSCVSSPKRRWRSHRRPFKEPGEGRRPTLTFPREIPIEGDPADVTAAVDAYADWLKTSSVPKLFLKADPGGILAGGKVLEQARSFPAQTEVTVKGVHFVQEDSPDEIGRAVAGWMKTLG
jgi:hypothetical protein